MAGHRIGRRGVPPQFAADNEFARMCGRGDAAHAVAKAMTVLVLFGPAAPQLVADAVRLPGAEQSRWLVSDAIRAAAWPESGVP